MLAVSLFVCAGGQLISENRRCWYHLKCRYLNRWMHRLKFYFYFEKRFRFFQPFTNGRRITHVIIKSITSIDHTIAQKLIFQSFTPFVKPQIKSLLIFGMAWF